MQIHRNFYRWFFVFSVIRVGIFIVCRLSGERIRSQPSCIFFFHFLWFFYFYRKFKFIICFDNSYMYFLNIPNLYFTLKIWLIWFGINENIWFFFSNLPHPHQVYSIRIFFSSHRKLVLQTIPTICQVNTYVKTKLFALF